MLTKQRINELNSFCKRVNIKFKDIELLNQAFNHRSISNENKDICNNERLEFLGDSVLGVVTASYLYIHLNNPEGDLAKIKSSVVSEKALAPVALEYGIDKLLVLGHGEEISGGRLKPAILADCMEAVIGAYYLDSGYKNAEKYVLEFIIPLVNDILENGMGDYKSELQEYLQKKLKCCPEYRLLKKQGPDHNQTFEIAVFILDKQYGKGIGKTKKEAEQKAAKNTLLELYK